MLRQAVEAEPKIGRVASEYQGPLVKNPDGTDNYAIEATQTQAAGLKGHLLLIHGTMDNNVSPYNTLLVADALIKANKEFDMIMVVNSGHGYAPGNYIMRRRWDYFVRYCSMPSRRAMT